MIKKASIIDAVFSLLLFAVEDEKMR